MTRTRSPPFPCPWHLTGATRTDPQRRAPGPALSARHRLRRVRPARRLRQQAYPPASGRPGGRWSSAYAPARCYPAGRQARLTAIWRPQVFRSRQALLPPAALTLPNKPVLGEDRSCRRQALRAPLTIAPSRRLSPCRCPPPRPRRPSFFQLSRRTDGECPPNGGTAVGSRRKMPLTCGDGCDGMPDRRKSDSPDRRAGESVGWLRSGAGG